MPRARLRTLLRLLAVIAVSALGLEGLIRLVLFVPDWTPEGTGLRRPELYFSGDDPRFWMLRARLNGHHELGPPDDPDPVLGWTSGRFDAETREHMDEARLGDQRPVLLVGDSFAACSGAPDRCYEHLLEEGPFGMGYLETEATYTTQLGQRRTIPVHLWNSKLHHRRIKKSFKWEYIRKNFIIIKFIKFK